MLNCLILHFAPFFFSNAHLTSCLSWNEVIALTQFSLGEVSLSYVSSWLSAFCSPDTGSVVKFSDQASEREK